MRFPARHLATAVVGLLVVVVAGCGPQTGGAATTEIGKWEPLPEAPISPRHTAQAYGLGDRFLLLGGTDEQPCPSGATCAPSGITPFREGAMFDLGDRTWTPIAEAPLPLGAASGAVLGDSLYLLVHGWEQAPGVRPGFVVYDMVANEWRELPLPPVALDYLELVATDDQVIAYHASHEHGILPDLIFDPSSATWAELPLDPLAPASGRTVVWTGTEAVAVGLELVPNPGSEGPLFTRATALDVDAKTWRRLPDSEILSGSWVFAGRRIVSPRRGSSDGGEVNGYGRAYPHGGILDPAAGTWSQLPDGPSPETGHPRRYLTSGDVVLAVGTLLDVPEKRWTEIPPRPVDADNGEAEASVDGHLIVWGGYRWNDDNLSAEFLDQGHAIAIGP